MSGDEAVQKLLDGWAEEWNLPLPVRFMGYEYLGKNVMGNCKSYADRSEVRLARLFEGKSLGWLKQSILWHEMCHAIAYQEDMKGNGHDSRWRELRDSNRKYMIGDWLSKLIYGPRCV